MTDTARQVVAEDAAEKLNGYVTDMLALEQHIRTALAAQVEGLSEAGEVKLTLTRLHAVCENHVNTLERFTQRREQNVGGVSKVMKKAVSSVLGFGAAAVDLIRTEKLPKDLRDDYTAISLAYIGSVMLHTAALGLGDDELADIAAAHLREHAGAMMVLQRIIPAATLSLLSDDGLQVDESVLATVSGTIDTSWR
jgi:hypothetical protein